jgi:hypothetical protein
VITNGTGTITGDIVTAGGGGVIHASGGNTTFAGNVTSTQFGPVINANSSGAVITWVGARSVSAGACAYVYVGGGTINFATASSALTLACSGSIVVFKQSGTLTLTNSGNNASLVRHIADGQISVQGVDATDYISGPTLPAAADVESGVEYGYAGDLQTGTLVGGGGGGEHSHVSVC